MRITLDYINTLSICSDIIYSLLNKIIINMRGVNCYEY